MGFQEFLDSTLGEVLKIASVGIAATIAYWARWHWQRAVKLLRAIDAEFRPNGGGSLRDQVMQIKQLTWSIASRQWAFVEGDGDPMWESDAAGNCIRANTALMHLTGRGFDQLRGGEWENIIHPKDRDRVWDEWCDAIEHRRTFESNYRVVHVHGSVHTVRAIATPIRDGDNISGWIGRYRSVAPAKVRKPKTS